MRLPQVGDIWEHYEGSQYRITSVGRRKPYPSEIIIQYELASASNKGQTWSDNLTNFLEWVGKGEKNKGKPRFTLITYERTMDLETLNELRVVREFNEALRKETSLMRHTLGMAGREWLDVVGEARRLKQGRLTVEEIHTVCHNLDEAGVTVEEFNKGCEEYQEQIFGRCPTRERNEEAHQIIFELLEALPYNPELEKHEPGCDCCVCAGNRFVS